MVGLPGETIEARQKVVYINNRPLEEPYAMYAVPDGRAESSIHKLDDWGPWVIPADHFFVLGDNRYNSFDSRFWGFLRHEALIGRAMAI